MTGNIEGFREDNETFRSDFNTQNEIIRRYDEVIMHKASIIRVEEMINEGTAKLRKQMMQLDNSMSSVTLQVSKVDPKFEDLRMALTEEMDAKLTN